MNFTENDNPDNISLEKLRLIAKGNDAWVLSYLEDSIFDVEQIRICLEMGRRYAKRAEGQIEGPVFDGMRKNGR